MGTPADLPPLRDVIRDFGLGARKSLGQHFLLDGNLTGRIARAADPLDGVNVIEIGPGPGGLTRALLASDATAVWAVEKDTRCIAALGILQSAYPGRLHILEADALDTDLTALTPAPRAIVANLPYNISTVLLLQWLRRADQFTRMVLMFQKEVADRLTAAPGSKAYGRLSVVTQWRAQVRPLFNVSKEAFTPPPKVASTVVEVIPRAEPLAPAVMTDLEKVTQAAFGQRRKMLRSSLKSLGLDPAQVGINPEARAEDLSVEEFCALARMLAERNA
ncbi:MAG TPA: 16S rRNA (adenine(1518)-N(6)/adenine(1519)-N(6))-dimethyltransferase [Rhodospirillaceae bacterium]|nr:16S rRNA (adenine(1518)-N(6)/adenine(1519)-N(6))-dimethyltransferase [Magnetovibrio sp.]HBT44165.1 16S rRNA (adenine(1518)-N(6)/adenine(1519)-N(6))-dimethyltransferase [Rhodospirillaceae bacterium]HCS69678.1 16S rRNA (adenine(1518)-N(6)/adenine(1519)-N(6))-dimethyltransferase [Rhodospirillaceae bacterium]|tara:strand:- start:507 stop:1334 length:828 start_codon:yes stop_codon:yes gene_type:complete